MENDDKYFPKRSTLSKSPNRSTSSSPEKKEPTSRVNRSNSVNKSPSSSNVYVSSNPDSTPLISRVNRSNSGNKSPSISSSQSSSSNGNKSPEKNFWNDKRPMNYDNHVFYYAGYDDGNLLRESEVLKDMFSDMFNSDIDKFNKSVEDYGIPIKGGIGIPTITNLVPEIKKNSKTKITFEDKAAYDNYLSIFKNVFLFSRTFPEDPQLSVVNRPAFFKMENGNELSDRRLLPEYYNFFEEMLMREEKRDEEFTEHNSKYSARSAAEILEMMMIIADYINYPKLMNSVVIYNAFKINTRQSVEEMRHYLGEVQLNNLKFLIEEDDKNNMMKKSNKNEETHSDSDNDSDSSSDSNSDQIEEDNPEESSNSDSD